MSVTWLCRSGNEAAAIDQEAGFLGDLVIEMHRRFVALVGLPIDPRSAGLLGAVIDRLDQRAGDALFAGFLGGIEVLHVAERLDGDRAAVKQEMGQAEQFLAAL